MNKKNFISRLAALLMVTVGLSSSVSGKSFNLNDGQVSDVLKIARRVNHINPRLDEARVLEYAIGIFRASRAYGVEADTLIAIAQQETTFRAELPEGAAGEIGIMQIRKMWLNNPNFVREFKKQTVKDLYNPAKSFMFAAWILSDLKKANRDTSLPYWSYYNAVKFENRLKYFLAVNRNVASLKRYSPEVDVKNAVMEAEEVDSAVEAKPAGYWKPAPVQARPIQAAAKKSVALAAVGFPTSMPKTIIRNVAVQEKPVSAPTTKQSWIANAIRNVQAKSDTVVDHGSRSKRSASVIRAAAELEVNDLLPQIIQD